MGLINSLIQFVSGTKALSAEVNQNFETLRTGHNDQESRLATAENSIVNQDTRLSAAETGITGLQNEKLNLSGGIMTGAISGITPTDAAHLTRKDYVDNILNSCFIDGLITSNNVSDANNAIDIAVGACVDTTKAVIIKLASALTKRLDATWAVGTNQGGLDTGTKTNSTWYYVYIISKADGTTDVLFSTSASSPTMPTDYVYKRRIGSIKTDSSGNILQGLWVPISGGGIKFIYKDLIADLDTTSNQAKTTLTLSTPLGIKTRPILWIQANSASSGTSTASMNIYPIDSTSVVFGLASTNSVDKRPMVIVSDFFTNTLSQIQYETTSMTNGGRCYIRTFGYYDERVS